jgi:hypothetical protein
MEPRKAKRKLSNIDFSGKDSHIALVHKDQGGPASGADYKLVLKASKFSDEFVTNVSQIRVTLELPEFLRKFFGLYYEDSELLAAMLGYVAPVKEPSTDSSYDDYIQSKLQSFEILKAAHEAENLSDVLSDLDEQQYLAMLTDQALLEKALKKLEKQQRINARASTESKPVVKATVEDTSIASEVKEGGTSSNVKQSMEKSMTQETQVIEKEVEVIEKAAFVALEKSLNEQKELLEKALLQVQQYEADKKEAIAKAKTEQVRAVIKDEGRTLAIAKAALSLESDDDFTAFMSAMQAMMTTVESSDMFIEKGATVETEQKPEVSHVERLLKAKFAK